MLSLQVVLDFLHLLQQLVIFAAVPVLDGGNQLETTHGGGGGLSIDRTTLLECSAIVGFALVVIEVVTLVDANCQFLLACLRVLLGAALLLELFEKEEVGFEVRIEVRLGGRHQGIAAIESQGILAFGAVGGTRHLLCHSVVLY